MPIKPENAKRYPPRKEWQEIRRRILERAGNRCEGSPTYPHCRVANGDFIFKGEGVQMPRVVLTIGHLDHTPEHNDAANLRAWCQRCHLTYDAKHHAQNAHKTRRSRKADGDLFP